MAEGGQSPLPPPEALRRVATAGGGIGEEGGTGASALYTPPGGDWTLGSFVGGREARLYYSGIVLLIVGRMYVLYVVVRVVGLLSGLVVVDILDP